MRTSKNPVASKTLSARIKLLIDWSTYDLKKKLAHVKIIGPAEIMRLMGLTGKA